MMYCPLVEGRCMALKLAACALLCVTHSAGRLMAAMGAALAPMRTQNAQVPLASCFSMQGCCSP